MFEPTYPQKRWMHQWTMNNRQLTVPIESDRPRIGQLTSQITRLVEPILADNVHGFRPRRSVNTAVGHIQALPGERLVFDIEDFFGTIDQRRLRRKLNRLDPTIWPQLVPWLREGGLPQGTSFSPVLSNLYLAELDNRFPQAIRYVDNIMIVADDPDMTFRRMQLQLADIGLTCHEIESAPTHFCKTALGNCPA